MIEVSIRLVRYESRGIVQLVSEVSSYCDSKIESKPKEVFLK